MLARAQLQISCSTRPKLPRLASRYRAHPERYYTTAAEIEAANDAFFAGSVSPVVNTHPLAHLRSGLTSRPYAVTTDCPTHIPSNLLHKTLFDFLPKSYHDALYKKRTSTASVPPGYHLIHFPPSDPLSALQSDGTDPAHSPGEPFNRRMWAGGFMHFYRNLPCDCRHRECVENIENVEIKGKEGEEKIFVLLKRVIADERSKPIILEGRTLVFMHDRPVDAPVTTPRNIKPPIGPDYSHTLTPSAGLLFRFSALTFNAHRIHLDKQYCQDVEGHRNLIFHGPLSVVFMLDMLQGYLGESGEEIERIEYRNLAPLYAEEHLKVCGKKKSPGEYEVWVEGPEGGLAVKGLVKTETPDAAVQKWRSTAR